MQNKMLLRILVVVGVLGVFGCGQSSSTTGSAPGAADSTAGNSASSDSSESKPAIPFFAPKPIVVNAGTTIAVTVDQAVSSNNANPGDHFDASLAVPVTVGEKQAIPSGAKVVGTVTDAKSAGKFNGNAAITVTLDSVTVNGQRYSMSTTSITEAGKGRGKRTGIGAGGGAAVGAIVGAIAGGGKGAAIGAGAGAGAGAAGAGFTGERDIEIAPETRLSFKLKDPLEIKGK